MRYKKHLSEILWFIAPTIFGIIFIILGIFLYKDQKAFNRENPLAYAVIDRIETHVSRDLDGELENEHEVYVTYYVDDQKYTTKLNEYSVKMHQGDKIKIHYDPSSPSNIKTESYLSSIMLCIVGALFALGGLLGIILRLRQ